MNQQNSNNELVVASETVFNNPSAKRGTSKQPQLHLLMITQAQLLAQGLITSQQYEVIMKAEAEAEARKAEAATSKSGEFCV